MLRFVFCLLIFSHAYGLKLIDELRSAKKGDYFVLNHKKTSTLMWISALSKESLVLEEVSAPLDKINAKEWFEENAPGHTSWIQTTLIPSNGRVTRAFCRVKNSLLARENKDHFITTLLTLDFKPVPKVDQKLCGISGGSDDLLKRKVWQPPKPKGFEKSQANPYFAYWPKDGSELAGDRIEIYLLERGQEVPTYFPIWIEVKKANFKGRIRVLEIGRDLTEKKGYGKP